MSIRVEFFGIPRERTGLRTVTVETENNSVRLEDVLSSLGERFPQLADECLDGGRLRRGYTANIGGERFVSSPDAVLCSGDCLLILSIDAGG